MGLKLLLVCALALVMSIPALFVFALLGDRTSRAEEVTREIGGLVGGPQTFLGPVIAVPYTTPPGKAGEAPGHDTLLIFPARGDATVASRTELRQRSLFKVPVYKADLAFAAHFAIPADVQKRAPNDATLDWSRAEFVIGASDTRGAQSDVTLTVAGRSLAVAPAVGVDDLRPGGDTPEDARLGGGGLRLFGATAAGLAQPGATFDAAAKMRFSGATRLAILAYGMLTVVNATGDWPSPSFDGGFLPSSRTIGAKGFTATWSVPFIARGVPQAGPLSAVSHLGQTALGVSFVEPANPYQSVGRSLKYALMFVGLVFLAYFIFETMQKRRVHPAQYVLIGLAQIVFYLLLLSIAERIGFDLAFLVAAGGTVGLISAYAGWVFASRRQGFIALAAFTLLYGLIYVLMRLEDQSLLVGALASFAAIAAVMYVTRRLDWYGAPAPTASPAPAAKETA
jgi:inner membrane protein